MSSLPSKAAFLACEVSACRPPEGLECPICQEGFETEGQNSNELEQVTSEPKQATSDTAEASSSRSPTAAATSNQSSTTQETSHQSSSAATTQNQSATAAATQSQSATNADRTPLRVPCCKKIYCRTCLFTWLDEANTCPTCRAVLFEQDPNFNVDLPPIEIGELQSPQDNNNNYTTMDYDNYYDDSDWDDGFDSDG